MGVQELLGRSRLLAIVRADIAVDLLKLGAALFEGGVRCLEFTRDTPGAHQALASLRTELGSEACLGMGTICTVEEAREAIAAGAEFLVSPIADQGVLDLCRDSGVGSLPGAFTPSEVREAALGGATAVKLFPAASMGPGYVASLVSTMPDVRLVPTGGITIASLRPHLQAGAWAVAVGGALVDLSLVRECRWDELRERASAFVAEVAGCR